MDGYKVVFDGRSRRWNGPVANIISDQSERVWGGLFKITDKHLLSLDKNEGYPKTYNRELMQVTNDAGARIEAWVYLRNGLNQGTPSQEYVLQILTGMRNCALPEDYISSFMHTYQQQHEN